MRAPMRDADLLTVAVLMLGLAVLLFAVLVWLG